MTKLSIVNRSCCCIFLSSSDLKEHFQKFPHELPIKLPQPRRLSFQSRHLSVECVESTSTKILCLRGVPHHALESNLPARCIDFTFVLAGVFDFTLCISVFASCSELGGNGKQNMLFASTSCGFGEACSQNTAEALSQY